MSKLKTRGSGNAQAKLNDSIILNIRLCLRFGASQRILAEHLRISESQMHRIVHRKNWAHVRD